MAKKTATADAAPKCPVSRAQLRTKGPASLTVKFFAADGTEVGGGVALRKSFESGSEGYYFGDKITVPVDGSPIRFQCGVNITAVGSKELPAA